MFEKVLVIENKTADCRFSWSSLPVGTSVVVIQICSERKISKIIFLWAKFMYANMSRAQSANQIHDVIASRNVFVVCIPRWRYTTEISQDIPCVLYTMVMHCRLEIINVLWPYLSSIGGRSWGVIVVVLCKTKIWIKNTTYIIAAVDFTSRHRPWTHENIDISSFTVHAYAAQWKSCWIEISPRIVVAVIIGCFRFFKTFFPVRFPRLLRADIA